MGSVRIQNKLVLLAVIMLLASVNSETEDESELTYNASDDTPDITGIESSFVRIEKFPEVLSQDSLVLVSYYCEDDSLVGLDLTILILDVDTYHTVFTRVWKCHGQGLEGEPRRKVVRLRLPDELAYRPDYFLRADRVWQVSWCKLKVWFVEGTEWPQEELDASMSFRSRDLHTITVLPPYSRPYKQPPCVLWFWPHVQRLVQLSDVQTCPSEDEHVTLLDYPAVFNGHTYSVLRQFQPYLDWRLERERNLQRYSPQFSVELWVYILEYCPLHHLSHASACGVFLHMDSLGWFLNPVILINKDGNIQIDMKLSTGFVGMKTTELVPKNVWTRIVFSFNERKWDLYVNYGPDMKQGFHTSHSYAENIYVDDTEGLMALGGIDWTMGSFVGYMGRAVFHRRWAMVPEQFSVPDSSHPMFQLHLARRQEKCEQFLSWMDAAVDIYQKHHRYVLTEQQSESCPNKPFLLFINFAGSLNEVKTCPIEKPVTPKHLRPVSGLLRKAVSENSLSRNFLKGELEAYARSYENNSQAILYRMSVDLLNTAQSAVRDRGLRASRQVVRLVKQAACLGNNDAMYALAVLLNNGVGWDVDEIQSLAFFMLGALNRHHFSIMALGHRHIMGLDGAHIDKEVAFMYYKQVADMTRAEKELHRQDGIMTEMIHLTDEVQLDAQTSEVGELFMWLKHQAEKGVASAQTQLGSMLYYGAQGVNRDLHNAVNIYRGGAEMGNVDAMFSYGLMQYRGMGIHANKTEGKRMLQKAADMNNPSAVSAMGWVALEEKNNTRAYELFLLAKALGHMDSGYYLGFMNQFGLVPNQTYDLDRALDEYLWSAKLGQVDAGNLYAFLLSRGTPRYPRDIYLAVEWARFIAERNAHLGIPLRKALNAYREGNYDLSVYFYLLLADTGMEVASFNLAFLCELNKNGVKSHITKECEWRHFNLSTQREPHFVDAYAYIKMGDYYWYGHQGKRNLNEAARHYVQAAVKGNPHAVFNLAFMVEEGVDISPVIWWTLQLTPEIYTDKIGLLLELYTRCSESRQSEAFIPCWLAWLRIWCVQTWKQYHLHVKISSCVSTLIAAAAVSYLIQKHLKQRLFNRVLDQESLAISSIDADPGLDADQPDGPTDRAERQTDGQTDEVERQTNEVEGQTDQVEVERDQAEPSLDLEEQKDSHEDNFHAGEVDTSCAQP